MKKKSIFKRWWFWLIVVVFIIGLANASSEPTAVVVDQVEDTATAEPTKAPEPTKKPEPTPEKTEFSMGEAVQLKDNVLTVSKVEKSAGSDWDSPKDGMEYVIVHVTIENAGKDNISYNPFDFKIANSQGQITDIGFITVNTDSALESGELTPGGKVSGTLAFEQPKDDPKLQLQYQPSFWSDKTIKVNLQ